MNTSAVKISVQDGVYTVAVDDHVIEGCLSYEIMNRKDRQPEIRLHIRCSSIEFITLPPNPGVVGSGLVGKCLAAEEDFETNEELEQEHAAGVLQAT